MATLLAESTARARTVREYEAKMIEMERKYQDRLREEVRSQEPLLGLPRDRATDAERLADGHGHSRQSSRK